MKISQRDRGSMTFQVLLVILFLSSLGFSLGLLLSAGSSQLDVMQKKDAILNELDGITKEVIEALRADMTPDSDSLQDAVWGKISELSSYKAVLEDISSRINLNWADRVTLEDSNLKKLFLPGKDFGALQEARTKLGFKNELEDYSEYFPKDVLKDFCTIWGWVDFNSCDEISLRDVVSWKTGNTQSGESLRSSAVNYRVQKKILKQEELKPILGINTESLLPLLTCESQWNVHFVPEKILISLLSIKGFKVPNPAEAAANILSLRQTSAITRQSLPGLFQVDNQNRLLTYFGTITWFWKLTLTKGTYTLETVICRIPQSPGMKPVYRVLSRKVNP